MTPLQALDLVDQAAALAPLNRAQQVQVVQAVALIRQSLESPPKPDPTPDPKPEPTRE